MIKKRHGVGQTTSVQPIDRVFTILCIDVLNMEEAVMKAIECGAALDGPIKYPLHGKVKLFV